MRTCGGAEEDTVHGAADAFRGSCEAGPIGTWCDGLVANCLNNFRTPFERVYDVGVVVKVRVVAVAAAVWRLPIS